MDRIYWVVLISFLSMYMVTGRAQESIVYQPEQMQADLEKFKTALIKVHPGTYTHQNHEEFNQMINDLMLRTSKPMEAKAFYRIVLQLIANIHDGHTQAYTFGKLGSVINSQKRLPFQVYIKDERIFIVKNLSSIEIPEGSEILSIDSNLSNEIIFDILAHYSSDGESQNGMQHWLGGPYKPFYRLYPEIFEEQPTYNLVYRDYKTKRIIKTKIEAISKEVYETRESKKYLPETVPEKAFNFEINKEENYAYLKISRFIKDGFDEPENTYPDFYKQCFKKISDKNIKNLIIDLRNNGGGKASNAAYLLQYFINQPITPAKEIVTLVDDKYFMEITGNSSNLDESFGLKRKKDGTFKVTKHESLRDLMNYDPIEEYRYKRRLIVLINGGTTSAAGIAAGLLKEYTNANFVGTETYGYAGISNGVRQISIKGDHTETAIYLPLLHAKYTIDEHIQKRSVVPDYNVSNSIQDILESNDAVLEFALKKLLPPMYKN
ncbi:S41 family peptidase [Aquimarina sp. Aq78]|uniref:S41 family peptidase n=1 Tax=Aquimarina sp. Aq78 TaxID=1191889 RepID=UPI000D0E51A8|nr:S41 family peptidase [Aquimarina sp. Aq78]